MKEINTLYIATLVTGIICFVLMLGSDAFAVNRSACAEDVAKYCKDVKPGKGAIADCLKQHNNELSGSCKDHVVKMEQRKENAREFHQECKDDVANFCKDVNPGGGRIVRCLKEHKRELSAPCDEKMKAAKEAREKMRTY